MARLATPALLALSLALSLVAAELAFRAGNFQIGEYAYNLRKYGRLIAYDREHGFTRHVANGAGHVYGVDMRFNAAGMRDREHGAAKPPGTRRVLVLGDSVTAGLGVTWEATFVHRLEEMLNAGSSAGPVEVIAAAVPGWNTVAQRSWFFAEGRGFDPDAVLLLYVSNDNEALLPWGPVPPQPWRVRVWQWLADHSRVVEAATFVYRRYRPRPPDPETWRILQEMRTSRARRGEEPHAFEPDDPGWLASREALAAIAAETRARGIPFAIVLYNLGGSDAPAVLERLREFSAESGVPVVDSLSWFAGRPAVEWINMSLHPNDDGHAVLAGGMARTLAEMGFNASPGARTAPPPRAAAGSPPSLP